MERYEPKFTMKPRERRGEKTIALWVEMPNGEKFNIWDLPKVPTEDMQQALQSAFSRGFDAAKMLVEGSWRYAYVDRNGFEMEEDE